MEPICETPFGKDQSPTPFSSSAASTIPPCPACAGRFIFLHNFYRCSRCGLSLCVGCEGGPRDGPSNKSSG